VDLRDAETGMAITGWAVGESVVTVPTPDRAPRATVPTMFVSANYFRTVGVALAQGPGFGAVESGAEPVVILGNAFWQNRLGSDSDIVGKTLTVNGIPHVVVGIAPEGYCWHLGESCRMELFVPLERHPRFLADARQRFDRDGTWVRMHGRLSPAATIPQANAAVAAVMSRLGQQYPATNQYKAASVEPYFAAGAQVRSELVLIQAALLALTGMVLLVVCLNISGMMQVRGAIRERELSIRQALGASRGRLVRYLLSESLMLAGVGGALAALVLFGTPQALSRWLGLPLSPTMQEALRPGLGIVALAVGLCLATSFVFGLLPAIRFSRPTLVSALKDDAGGGGYRIGRIHRLMAALQVGIALPFLIVSGAMVDWVRTTAMDLGFDPDGLAVVQLDLNRLSEGESADFLLRRVRDDLQQATGVHSVTLADTVPLDFEFRGARASRPDRPDVVVVRHARVSDSYLGTLDIPLLRGRGITAGDVAGAEPVAVISKPLADRLFGADEPIGERLTLELEENKPSVFTIVGVTGDFVGRSLDGSRAQVLLPLAQHPASRVFLVARVAPGIQPMALAPAFQTAVRDFDPDFTAASLTTGDQLKQRGMEDITVPAVMVGGGGAAVLMLAALGIYGVIAFMVATRTREIAVRVALGASRRRMLGMVQADVVRLVIPGVAGGLLLAIAVVRLAVPWRGLAGAAMEPVIYALGVAVAVAVALLAGLAPARRAASVDPMAAMRSQ
jgi:predicted permease